MKVDPGAAQCIEHLLVTRFSIRIGDATSPQPRSWVEERLALFERFTVPTLRAQQVADFTWWLLCDPQTDPDVADRLHALDPRIRLAMIGPEGEHDAVRARADLVATGWRAAGLVRPETTILVQTRLDSDDGLHPAFLQDVTDDTPLFLASGSADWLRVAACGYQVDTRSRRVFRRITPRGPFQSYYQHLVPGQPAITMPSHHGIATLTITGMASYARWSWLQVVHGGNIDNRIASRERVRDVDTVARTFGVDL